MIVRDLFVEIALKNIALAADFYECMLFIIYFSMKEND